jgi:hypothetical protein
MYEKRTEENYGYEKILVLIYNPFFRILNVQFQSLGRYNLRIPPARVHTDFLLCIDVGEIAAIVRRLCLQHPPIQSHCQNNI